jgi:hypothetical protein
MTQPTASEADNPHEALRNAGQMAADLMGDVLFGGVDYDPTLGRYFVTFNRMTNAPPIRIEVDERITLSFDNNLKIMDFLIGGVRGFQA